MNECVQYIYATNGWDALIALGIVIPFLALLGLLIWASGRS